jgi:serine/threonine-protein kinase
MGNRTSQLEEKLFAAAIELQPSQRRAYLWAACANDPELRKKVESLVRAHEEAGGFLRDRPAKSWQWSC